MNVQNYTSLDENGEGTKWKYLSFLTNTQTLFYYSALISSWDDRSWYFLMGIYLIVLDPRNLILTAVFGFLSSGIVLVLGSVIGSWTDRASRRKAAFVVLSVRNISTLICSVCLCLVLFFYDYIIINDEAPILRTLSQVTLVTFGILAHMAGLVNNNIIGKDWLPIFCMRDSYLLSKMTSRFRLIDMVSTIIAPIIIGQIITYAGKSIAAIVFSVQVLITLLMLTFLLNVIYRRLPRLHYREEIIEIVDEYSSLIDKETRPTPSVKVNKTNSTNRCLLFIEGWIVYYKESIMLAGLALAFLYMTVLGFDTVTIGYALSQGVLESELSYFNAGAAVTGIIGALLFPYVTKCTNLITTGVISSALQFFGLLPCLFSVWAVGSPFNLYSNSTLMSNISLSEPVLKFTSQPILANHWTPSILLLMSGIIISRTGLWMFDLTVSQLLVETVAEVNRGKVNGVQNSLNMFFDMTKFALVFVWPLPRQFGLLVLLSIGAVGTCNIFYSIFALRQKCRMTSFL